MSDEVMIALISAGIPTIATAITAVIQARANNKHAAKQSIFPASRTRKTRQTFLNSQKSDIIEQSRQVIQSGAIFWCQTSNRQPAIIQDIADRSHIRVKEVV